MLCNPESPSSVPVKPVKPVKPKSVKTEDTGKTLEMAICLAYGIPYNGNYRYDMELPTLLKPRLSRLVEFFPTCRHTANKGARYDYTSLADDTHHLSAKSTKRGVGKVAPQVIGQSQPNAFCERVGIEYTTIPALKEYLQRDILLILPILTHYTFDCPTVYYHQEKNTIRYIRLNTPIEWVNYQFSWTRGWKEWGNSSTLKVQCGPQEVSLLEIQFHTKKRTNMAIRWCYENFLTLFKKHLTIVQL